MSRLLHNAVPRTSFPDGHESCQLLESSKHVDLVRLDFTELAAGIQHAQTVRDLQNQFSQEGGARYQAWTRMRELLIFSQCQWAELARTTPYKNIEDTLELAKELTRADTRIFALYERESERLLGWAQVCTSPNVLPYEQQAMLSPLQIELNCLDKNIFYAGPMLVDRRALRLLGRTSDPTIELLNCLRASVPEGILVSIIGEHNPVSAQSFTRAGFLATKLTSTIDQQPYRWFFSSSELITQSSRYCDSQTRQQAARLFAGELAVELREAGGPILVVGSRELVTKLAPTLATARPTRSVLGLIETHDQNVYQELDTDTRRPSAQGNLRYLAMNFDYWYWAWEGYQESRQRSPNLPKLYAEPEFEPLAAGAFETIFAEARIQGTAPEGNQHPHRYWNHLQVGGQLYCLKRGAESLGARLDPLWPQHCFEQHATRKLPWDDGPLWCASFVSRGKGTGRR